MINDWKRPIESQVFSAILSSTNIRDAARKVPMNPEDMIPYLRQIGVLHGEGYRVKKSVQDFIDAGKPIQLLLPFDKLS